MKTRNTGTTKLNFGVWLQNQDIMTARANLKNLKWKNLDCKNVN